MRQDPPLVVSQIAAVGMAVICVGVHRQAVSADAKQLIECIDAGMQEVVHRPKTDESWRFDFVGNGIRSEIHTRDGGAIAFGVINTASRRRSRFRRIRTSAPSLGGRHGRQCSRFPKTRLRPCDCIILLRRTVGCVGLSMYATNGSRSKTVCVAAAKMTNCIFKTCEGSCVAGVA